MITLTTIAIFYDHNLLLLFITEKTKIKLKKKIVRLLLLFITEKNKN